MEAGRGQEPTVTSHTGDIIAWDQTPLFGDVIDDFIDRHGDFTGSCLVTREGKA